MKQMDELIEKLEGATEGNFELSLAVADALLVKKYKPDGPDYYTESGEWIAATGLTTDLNAALALAKDRFPRSRVIVEFDRDDTGSATIILDWLGRGLGDPPRFYSEARTPALAVCIALLSALKEQNND